MTDRCKRCGTKIIKFPIWKGQEEGKPFSWDKVIWLNLFKVDIMSIIIFALIIFVIMGYKIDMKKCEDAIEYPCEFCEETNCCKVDWDKIRPQDVYSKNVNLEGISNLNHTLLQKK